jgi:membrane fusion protein, multidrug efflux system
MVQRMMLRLNPGIACAYLSMVMLVAGCSGDQASQEEAKVGPRATIVSTAQVEISTLEILERSVGALESVFVPEVSAEVEGRVIASYGKAGQRVEPGTLLVELDTEDYTIAERGARAEAAQLTVLQANQSRTVERYKQLIETQLISKDRYDDAEAQLEALNEQLKAANERLKQKQRGLTKTRVISPYSGVVDAELASIGDFVKVGDPLLRITKIDKLRARLPLPETLAPKISRGQEVRLVSPLDPDTIVVSEIKEIRPTVGTSNRAIDVLTIIDNPGKWLPGASVTGVIVLAVHERAVTVPIASIVLRPSGKVVFVVEDGIAQQRIVEVGEYMAGKAEVLSGLSGEETIVVNGAGFLTDGSPITVNNG